MGNIGELSKNFWKIISMFAPGVIILEVVFQKGLFHNLPNNWFALIIYLIWAIIISIPYFNMSTIFWISILLKDNQQKPDEDMVYVSAASISIIYALIHAGIFFLVAFIYMRLFQEQITLQLITLSYILIFLLTYYHFMLFTRYLAERMYKELIKKLTE
ncbi:hypothetical protein HZA96_05305 [Candidatus Woesearchaeota archaeon]|nr:hypothetical protein [Candidatus Woesearchaeota archaeon]